MVEMVEFVITLPLDRANIFERKVIPSTECCFDLTWKKEESEDRTKFIIEVKNLMAIYHLGISYVHHVFIETPGFRIRNKKLNDLMDKP